MEEEATERLSKIVRISGYSVAGGAFVGFSLGLYFLFNRAPFSFFILISQFEVTSYFLGVSMPSFVILVVIGYLFATTSGLKRAGLSNVTPLCLLSLLCMALSALSAFYLLSFLGGFLALMASIKAFTKPAFKILSNGEALFFVDLGAMLVASFASLHILMWLISNFLQTYAMGLYGSYSPHALLWILILSFLMFFAVAIMDSRSKNPRLCGAFGLIISVLSFLFVLENRYVLLNPTAYIGVFLLVLGSSSALVGDLIYLRLSFSERSSAATILTFSPLLHGKYCPYCGEARDTPFQSFCSHCGRSLLWAPGAPFCSSCGLVVSAKAQTCPHCQEDIRNKRLYFHWKDAKEQAIAKKLMAGSRREKSGIMKGLSRMSQALQPAGRALPSVNRFLNVFTGRVSSTLFESVFIIVTTCLLSLLFFWAVRILILRTGA